MQRVGVMLLTLFCIVSIAFFVLRLMPGSPYSDLDELSAEAVAALEAKMHLDKPLIVQYFYFLKGVVAEGNFGVSIKLRPGLECFSVLKERIPITMLLNCLSLLVSIPLGILSGTIAGIFKNKWPDYLVSFMVVLCISIPSFVFASLMQYFFAFRTEMFPALYAVTADFFGQMKSLILPVAALSLSPVATITRYLRGELVETLSSEYMLLARTKGLRKSQAVVRHAFRNSMVPLANIIIPMVTHVMGGSMVVEDIFGIPGIGGIMVESINVHDYSLTMAALLFYAFINVATILIVDISYGIIDPRIRLGAKK